MFVDLDGRAAKRVFLTFDDGPQRGTTPRALDVLDKAGVKATFFVRGDHIKGNEDILFDIARRGHFIGNHTFTHPTFATSAKVDKDKKALIDNARIVEEFEQTDKLIKESLAAEKAKAQASKTWGNIPEAQRKYIDSLIERGPDLYRVPQFSQNDAQKKFITERFGPPRAAHTDPHDADTIAKNTTLTDREKTQKTVDNILNGEPATADHDRRLGVRDQPFNDVFVLQHDTLGFSVDAIPEIIERLKAEGHTFGGQLPEKPVPGARSKAREEDKYIYYPGEAIEKSTGKFHFRPGPKW
jgi:peptidoglycan/xylan/chitin deacetylase (PgdA/CDA1 family)